MNSEFVDRFWENYCAIEPSIDAQTPFQVWHFGNTVEMAKDLVGLVLSGRKTATSSSAKMDELEPANAPQLDGYSVVTDFLGEPICVIQTVEVRHIPFNLVDAEFAADEGEGDLSLDHWRQVHWDYFTREGENHGFEFDANSIVCCERFKVLFPR